MKGRIHFIKIMNITLAWSVGWQIYFNHWNVSDYALLYPWSRTRVNSADKPLTATMNTFRWASQLFVEGRKRSTSDTITRASLLPTVSNIVRLQHTFISQGFYGHLQTAALRMTSQPKQARVDSKAANYVTISGKRYSQPEESFLWTPD